MRLRTIAAMSEGVVEKKIRSLQHSLNRKQGLLFSLLLKLIFQSATQSVALFFHLILPAKGLYGLHLFEHSGNKVAGLVDVAQAIGLVEYGQILLNRLDIVDFGKWVGVDDQIHAILSTGALKVPSSSLA